MLQTYICTTSGVVKHKDNVFADEERFFHNYEKRLLLPENWLRFDKMLQPYTL